VTAYAYTGVDSAGRAVKGRREATNETSLRDALVAERLTPLTIVETGAGWRPSTMRYDLSEAAAASFAGDLARFLGSGLSLGQTLQIIQNTAEAPRLAALAGHLRDELMQGAPLSSALQAVPGQTGRFLQSLARAGEATGRLTEILAGGAAALRASAALKRRLLTLLIYPAFVLAMACGAISLFAFAVLPALEPAFAGVSAQLPPATRAVLAGGRVLRVAAPFLAGALGLCIAALIVSPQARGLVRRAGEAVLLTPIGLGILQDTVFASLAQRLAVALKAGVPTVAAFRVSVDAVGVTPLRNALLAQEGRMREGAKISEVLKACRHTPVLLISLAQVGETAADLPRVLGEAGETLSTRAQEKTERVLALLTPAIVLLVGVVVGSIVLMVFQGLLAISSAVDI
jgi:general secretion pathway protein F